jgi:peptidoglycan/xylan/chitin deacetylase (PgdA/CDA1 family)
MDADSGIDMQARRARREESRRRIKRRRRLALAGLAVVCVAVVALALTQAGGGASRPAPKASAKAHAQRHAVVAARKKGPPGKQPVPILMYHVIAEPPAGAPFPGLYVPAGEFAQQMQALKRAGWHAVTPDEVEAYWREGVPLGPGKPIVLSFDNGYQSQYTQALPVLRRLGWVGEENLQLSGLPPSQGGLGQDEIHGLVKAGWELDTQGISHADLITLDAAELHEQVAVARRELQQRFHVPVNWFCYPSGHYDATVVAAVKEAGFVGSTTVVPGWAHPTDDPYRLHRLRVLGGTSAAELLALVAGVRDDPPAPASYGEA